MILQKYYEITIGWSGAKYIKLTLDSDYGNQYVQLSMPGYIAKAIERFQVELPQRRQDSPYPHHHPVYGAKAQYVPDSDTLPLLDAEGKKYIQAVTGTFLYYAWAVGPTILVAVSAITTQQSAPTQETKQ